VSDLIILKPGTDVTLLGGIKAVITAVLIEDFDRISYKAIWPNGANLEEKWIPDCAIEKPQHNTIKAGFAREA
jgi:hypothetical protein